MTTRPAHEPPSTPEHTGPLLEYVTLPNCRDCVRFAELLAAAVPDFPTVEVREIPAESARGRQLSIEQGIMQFPVIALQGKIIAIESIAEDELRQRLQQRRGRSRMDSLLLGSSVLGGFIGGLVALLAPCCVTVLLPSYFAATFTSLGSLLRMTFLFAAGIAVVILPTALGLAALGAFFSAYHGLLFGVGGLLLLALGIMTLRGRGFELPFGRAPTFASHPGASIFALGVFSGAASSCCAPVLIGILTLTALTTSLPGALAVSLAYVFGMVFPLFVLALAGDRLGWSRSRLVRGTMVDIGLFGRRLSVHSTNLIGGVLFVAMGVLVLVLAFTGNEFLSVPGLSGVGVWLRQVGDRFLAATTWLPGIVAFFLLVAIGAFFWWQGRRASAKIDEDTPR